jgi:Collagenase and related proteases
MEICTGVKDISSLKKYINAGATEFYCGVIDEMWLEQYNYSTPLNRRPWPEANFFNFLELSEAVNIAHSNNCKVYYTLNEHCYNNTQLEIIKKHIEQLVKIDIDAIIVSDVGIISFLQENNYINEIHISTGGVTFNQYTVKFYVDEFKANRIVLPRSLSIEEINKITKDITNVDYEIFIKNEGCTFIDGFCNFIHGIQYIKTDQSITYNPPCELKYKIKEVSNKKNDINVLEQRLDRVLSSKGNCGICSLYLLDRPRIKSLKVVSRDTCEDKIVTDILNIKESIKVCNEVESFSEYSQYVKTKMCKNNYKNKQIFCYYPEVIKK